MLVCRAPVVRCRWHAYGRKYVLRETILFVSAVILCLSWFAYFVAAAGDSPRGWRFTDRKEDVACCGWGRNQWPHHIPLWVSTGWMVRHSVKELRQLGMDDALARARKKLRITEANDEEAECME